MKKSFLTIGLSLVTILAFGQRKEIRKAGDAVEDGDYKYAKSLLNSVEGQVASEKDRIKGDFYLAKGRAYLGAKPETATIKDLMTSANAFQKAVEYGEDQEGEQGLTQVKDAMVNSAIADQNQQKLSSSAEKLIAAYDLNTQDTIYLYYAAANMFQAGEKDKALEYFQKLDKMGYTGEGIQYTAVEKETGEVQTFQNKKNRDIYIKSGDYINPGEEKIPSKKGDIIRSIAQIHIENDNNEKAIEAINRAKAESPDDPSLMLAEANIYYRMGKLDKYSELVEKVIEKDPNNAGLYYNLGITSMQMERPEKAVEYYKQAIEIDPSMTDAYINLASAKLMKEQEIIDEMNNLGMSKEDNKRYEELGEERKELYQEALPYLEKATELDPNNTEAIRTLRNIYLQLGEDEKAEQMKNKLN